LGKTPLEDLIQIQFVSTRIPSGALHKLQVSGNHEVPSHARRDLTKLKKKTNKWDGMEIVYEKAQSKNKEQGEHRNGLE